MVTFDYFGTTEQGEEVLAYTIADGACKAVVLTYGGILNELVVPDRNGNPTSVVLGYRELSPYEKNGGRLGALIGRFANRIANAKMTIDGKEYHLTPTDGTNTHHGGKIGFDKKIWKVSETGDNWLQLSLFSPDGDEHYPGNLTVTVTYELKDGALSISYRATTDQKTVVNLTNHAYFNLNGEGNGNILDHKLRLESDEIALPGPNRAPEGGFYAVKGTPFDFNTPKLIGRDIQSEDEVLRVGNGYDHCVMLKNKCGEFIKYAVAKGEQTGITMTCYTDMPAVHFYSGNGLHVQGRKGYYGAHAGFCLETQAIPNNINVPEYAERGSSLLDVGEVYQFRAVYQFETDKKEREVKKMFCKNCGTSLNGDESVCPNCGAAVNPVAPQQKKRYCTHCGSEVDPKAYVCVNCGCKLETTTTPPVSMENRKSKLAGGLLGIFLGMFGAHNFYLGYTGKAVAQLLITLLSLFIFSFVSEIWGLIEGIMILAGSIPNDAKGIPLKD